MHGQRKPFAPVASLCVSVMLVLLGTLAAAEPAGPGLPQRFVCTFDEGLHAAVGAVNPFVAAGRVQVVQVGGDRGGVLRFEGHDPLPEGVRRPIEKSALIVDGKNVPVDAGTIGFQIRWSGKRHWADGQRTWLAVLVPTASAGAAELGEKGTALALLKDADNSLVLGAYRFDGNRLAPNFRSPQSGLDVAEPDPVAMRIPAGELPHDGWAMVRLAWDAAAQRVWLGVGERAESATLEMNPGPWLCLVVGSPPEVSYGAQAGFDGELDNLIVDARTPEQATNAGIELPVPCPPMAQPQPVLQPALHLAGDAWGVEVESLLRTHSKRVVETQKSGGWAYSVAFPSMLRFLSSKVVIPYTEDYVACSKDQTSAGAAIRLLAAYEALGDSELLKAVERTAAVLLALQQPPGNWVYGARVDPASGAVRWVLNPHLAPFEDHVQSFPVLLFWRLQQVTGEARYGEAAARGVEFILKGQNPNGSWAHHYSHEKGCGQAARGNLNAGEINDYATTDQMQVMLLAYRRSGDPRYLASYLRGADWLVLAFIDKQAKGWAQQYDENNAPIQARHFEPAAVSLSEGISAAPLTLLRVYRLTGDARYLEPLRKWRTWMLENRVVLDKEKNTGGWYDYYDVETGKPIAMADRKVMDADPRSVGDKGFMSILKRIETPDQPAVTYTPGPETAKAALEASRNGINFYVTSFDRTVGSWPYDHGPNGVCFSPQTVRVQFLSWAVYVQRQLAGQIPWTHPWSALTMQDWADLFSHVLAPAERDKLLTADEIGRTRAVTR